MTYCLALRLDEGLLFLSDTRTNAGVDNVGTYRKLHVLRPAPDRVFVLQSAGNLATTQEVLDRIDSDLAGPATTRAWRPWATCSRRRSTSAGSARRWCRAPRRARRVGADATATFILGGQIAGERPDITLVYPEGNYIRASDERPFLQIGESKYGKFMLELAVHAKVDMDDAIKVALSSMVSTARANLSVGPPYDLAVYRNGSLDIFEHRIEATSEYLHELSQVWVRHLTEAIGVLPPIPPLPLP